jgi:hypothetical protein
MAGEFSQGDLGIEAGFLPPARRRDELHMPQYLARGCDVRGRLSFLEFASRPGTLPSRRNRISTT